MTEPYPYFPDMTVDAIMITGVRAPKGPLGNTYPEVIVRIQTCFGANEGGYDNKDYKFTAIITDMGDLEILIKRAFKDIYGDFIQLYNV